jgi:predicted DNA-binding transcriptional regulator AlpA
MDKSVKPATATASVRMAYSIKEFIERNGISRATVYEESKRGRLKIRKIGGKSVVLAIDERDWRNALPLLHAS